MFLKGFAALLHFDENNGLPNEISEGGAAAVFGGFANAEFGLAADFEDAGVAEGLEETVEEDLGLAFFVADDVFLAPVNEGGEFGIDGGVGGLLGVLRFGLGSCHERLVGKFIDLVIKEKGKRTGGLAGRRAEGEGTRVGVQFVFGWDPG